MKKLAICISADRLKNFYKWLNKHNIPFKTMSLDDKGVLTNGSYTEVNGISIGDKKIMCVGDEIVTFVVSNRNASKLIKGLTHLIKTGTIKWYSDVEDYDKSEGKIKKRKVL